MKLFHTVWNIAFYISQLTWLHYTSPLLGKQHLSSSDNKPDPNLKCIVSQNWRMHDIFHETVSWNTVLKQLFTRGKNCNKSQSPHEILNANTINSGKIARYILEAHTNFGGLLKI